MGLPASAAEPVKPLQPVYVAHLFPDLHGELLSLLDSLGAGDWSRPTPAGSWAVRDVVAHLLDGDIRKLTFHRDRLLPARGDEPTAGYRQLVAFLDDLNAEWVAAARRIGPRLLRDFLALTGPQVASFVAGLDPQAEALFPVSWAGESRSLNWLDTGREYTERWHHQQQIREAVGVPLLVEPRWLRPVLEVSIRALPFAYRATSRDEGCSVAFVITGDSGGEWALVRSAGGWTLFAGRAEQEQARVTMNEDTAWRLLLKALRSSEARATVRLEGERELAEVSLGALAVMG